MECLLSMIEIHQIEDYLCDNDVNNEIDQEAKQNLKRIVFPANVPETELLKYTDIADITRGVFMKYIESGSEFEVNIPSGLRSDFMSTLQKQNINWGDLMLLLERWKQEMRMLLMYSFGRFKKTAEFDQIIKIFNQEMNLP